MRLKRGKRVRLGNRSEDCVKIMHDIPGIIPLDIDDEYARGIFPEDLREGECVRAESGMRIEIGEKCKVVSDYDDYSRGY